MKKITLLLDQDSITRLTAVSFNTDLDRFLPYVRMTQTTDIVRILTKPLYDKIVADKTANTLSGLYLELYNDFIKPITKNESVAQYIEIASYMVDNAGIYKHTGDKIEVVDKQEVQFLAGKYKNMAQMYVIRFNKWICKNYLPEYKCYQDEVNAIKGINLTAGWKL